MMEFSRRETCHRIADEEWEGKTFLPKSQNYAEQLGRKQPDIVEKINESNRIEQEKERLRKEKVGTGMVKVESGFGQAKIHLRHVPDSAAAHTSF